MRAPLPPIRRLASTLARRSGVAPSDPAGAFDQLEPRQLLAAVFAVTSDNTLIQFQSDNPSVIQRSVPIIGLSSSGERIAAIDFKPGLNGGAPTLFGVASGTRTPIYTINPTTGVATLFANGLPGSFPLDIAVGFDYDDLNNVFRYTDELSGTYRFDGDTGVYIRNDAGVVGLTDSAYRPTGGDAGLFQMVGVLYNSDEFAVINPTTGALISQGGLGLDVDKWVGLDAMATGAAMLTVRSGGITRFGTIGADGHSFVELGIVGSGTLTIRGMSVDPSSNASPVLDDSFTPRVGTISEDDPNNAPTTIASLIGSAGAGFLTDANAGALQGAAIIGANTAEGSWQFSLDGSVWNDLGAVSENSALLLPQTARVRFVPTTNFNGSVIQALRFRAWDQTGGAAGTRVDPGVGGAGSAFSIDAAWAAIDVLPVRDPPAIVGGAGGGVISITEKQTATPFQNFSVSYIDDPTTALIIDASYDAAQGDFTDDSLLAAGFARVSAGLVRFTGNAAQATSAVQQLIYQPAQNIAPVGDTTLSLLTLLVDDTLGQAAQAFAPFIASLSVRDAATITGLLSGSIPINDLQTATPLLGVEFGYADDADRTLSVDVTIGSPLGSFTPESLAASGFFALDATTYRFNGTAADASTATRQLVFRPGANAATPGLITPFTIGLAVNDGLGPASTAAGPTVEVLSVNDAPAGAAFSPLSRIRLNKTVKPFRNVRVTDIDGGETVTALITINKPLKGKFTTASRAASGFVFAGRGKFRVAGSPAQVQTALRKLVYKFNAGLSQTVLQEVRFTVKLTDASGAVFTNNQTVVRLKV